MYGVTVAYCDVKGGRARYQSIWEAGDEVLTEWEGNLEDQLGQAFLDRSDGSLAARVTVKRL